MDVKKLRERKIGKAGKITEKVMQIKKKNGRMTLRDVVDLRAKYIKDGEKQFGNNKFAINHVKVCSGGKWVTFTDEQKFNDYFDSKVKDPTKFYEFNEVNFIFQYQE